MKLVKIKVIRGWQDLGTRFNFGDEMLVYDPGHDSSYLWTTKWGQYLIPRSHVEEIRREGGEGE